MTSVEKREDHTVARYWLDELPRMEGKALQLMEGLDADDDNYARVYELLDRIRFLRQQLTLLKEEWA